MPINVFVPSFHVEEILAEIRICLERGWTGLGFKTNEFEKKWNDYTGLPHSHFLASNTVGLHLALNIFKSQGSWQDGDEVITTPLTFVSTNHAILYERFQPVFADVDPYLCLDPASVEACITPRTRAVIFVGMGGNTGQYGAVRDLCRKHGLKLILDAAHMSGSRLEGQHVGHDADVAVFSFQAVKNLPTADSGMICFKDENLDAIARKQSWLGINKDTYQRFDEKENRYRWKYDVDDLGFKYHGNSIQASMGLIQLKYLETDNKRRREICDFYEHALSERANIKIVKTAPGCESARHLFQIMVENRELVLNALAENQIFPGVHYRDNTEYKMYSYARGSCPRSHEYSEKVISLPLHLRLTDDDCAFIIERVKDATNNL